MAVNRYNKIFTLKKFLFRRIKLTNKPENEHKTERKCVNYFKRLYVNVIEKNYTIVFVDLVNCLSFLLCKLILNICESSSLKNNYVFILHKKF